MFIVCLWWVPAWYVMPFWGSKYKKNCDGGWVVKVFVRGQGRGGYGSATFSISSIIFNTPE